MQKTHNVKCSAKDCNRIIEAPIKAKRFYCSIECACYDGAYRIKKEKKVEVKVPTRIRIIEVKKQSLGQGNYFNWHTCGFYIDSHGRKSRKPYKKFSFIEEEYHRELIDLAKVADGRLSASACLFHLNSTNKTVKELAQLLLERRTK